MRFARWLILSAQLSARMASSFAVTQPAVSSGGVRLRTVSWNVAAVNNNPFEYWITHPSPEYKQLMESVEQFIVDPGVDDKRVDQIFTADMFEEVMKRMSEAGMTGLDQVRAMWESNYRGRRVVSEFLRDPLLGKKRLASMPDRVTNTIQLRSGQLAFRPTVINCYDEEIASLEDWFSKWVDFFFELQVEVDDKGPKRVYELLQKIKKSKYPDVTEEEESVSIPLQIVLQGVFDAILINLMMLRGGTSWQSLRKEICASLHHRKNTLLLEILSQKYADADVIFLQEAGNQLVEQLRKHYGSSHELVLPKSYNSRRNQNSIMLLRSSLISSVVEIEVPADGWDAGDLLLVRAKIGDESGVAFASFHGDTNGLLTAPMLKSVMRILPGGTALVFGMDANTYEKTSSSTASVVEFQQTFTELGLQSCWPSLDPSRYTTFNARTYLQPQLNKAAKSNELALKGDRNPKDFVLLSKEFKVADVWRDNTGRGEFIEDMVFPTMDFPSDHALVAVDLALEFQKQEL